MKIDTLLLKGNIHEVYGEDSLFTKQFNDEWFIGAVMDGCSSGTDSHFASALMSKLIAKSCKTIVILNEFSDLKLDEMSPKELGLHVLNQVFDDLKKSQKSLMLTTIENLSTLLLMIYHQPSKRVFINVSGDGFFMVNDEVTTIDQNNTPNYMAFHSKLKFDDWLTSHSISYEFDNVKHLAISSDGIMKYFDADNKPISKVDTLNLMLKQDELNLRQRHDLLVNNYKLVPFDDVSVIILDA